VSAAWLCALLLEEVADGFHPGTRVWALPAALPYLWILWRLRAKTRIKGLALAVVVGGVGAIWGLLSFQVIVTDPCPCGSPPLRVAFAGLLALSQLALIPSAILAHRALKREGYEKPTLRADIFRRALYAGLPLLLVGGILIPVLLRPRIAGLAGPATMVRTINAAEMTYAQTYKGTYSYSLAVLGRPTEGSEPSASAAGLIDDFLASGVKTGYRFEYKPGPVENGRIQAYAVTARPTICGCMGKASYYSDQTGIIRMTNENRPATANDPPIP
jgi:hypothetical protein